MLRPLEREEPKPSTLPGAVAAHASEPIVPAIDHEAFDPSLPRDHPKWVRDTLSVSSRAKALAARLRPVAVRILGFWDHRIRSLVVGGLRVSIDASGSYRVR